MSYVTENTTRISCMSVNKPVSKLLHADTWYVVIIIYLCELAADVSVHATQELHFAPRVKIELLVGARRVNKHAHYPCSIYLQV